MTFVLIWNFTVEVVIDHAGDTSKDTIYGCLHTGKLSCFSIKTKEKVALISRPLLRYGQIELVSCPYDVCDIRLEAQGGREKDMAHREWWEETRDHVNPAVRDLIFPRLNTENRNSTGHDITLSGEPTSLQTAKRETSSLHKTVALRVLWWSNASSCEKQK